MGGHRDLGSLSCVDWDPRVMEDELVDEWAMPPEPETNQDVGQEAEQEVEVQEESADDAYTEIDDDCVEDEEVQDCTDDDYTEEFQEEEEDEDSVPQGAGVEGEAEEAGIEGEGEWGDNERPRADRGELHLYYSNLSSLANIHLREPHLTVLSMIGQPLEKLDGVEHLRLLKELWAVECKLNNVSAVESCLALEKLYLYSNRIQEVPRLEHLRRLRVLWLASNDITQVSRFPKAPALVDLNLSKNRITSLVAHWANSLTLTTLNLSANPLFLLTDILPLRDAPNLQNFQLADPMYGECPVAQLCNYRSYVVHQIPTVTCLEQLLVTEEERYAVEAFYAEKTLYYNMLRHHYQNLYMKDDRDHILDYYQKVNSYKCYSIRYKLKHLWGEQKEGEYREDSKQSLATKIEHLNYKVKVFEKDLKEWKKFHAFSLDTRLLQISLEQLHTGNLRFREFSGDCEPMVICQRLLDSYVCHHLTAETGIRGTELLEVTHVTNKGLEVISNLRMGTKMRRASSIMLLVPRDGLSKPQDWPFDVVKKGFLNSGEYEVSVTNCLYYADRVRMNNRNEARRHISPAFSDSTPADSQYERRVAVVVLFARDTLLVPRERCHEEAPLPAAEPRPAHAFLPRGSAAGPGSGRPCCTFMIANAQLVLSMMVLEFRYVYADPLEEFRQRMAWTTDVHQQTQEPLSRCVGVLDESTLPTAVSAVRRALGNVGIHTASLTTLVLTACGIITLGNLPKLETITFVDLSFNKLVTFKGLDAFSGVRELDLSYNDISLSEEHVRPRLPQLQTLDLSWNCVSRFQQAVLLLRRIAPEVSVLDLRYNPIDDVLEPAHVAFMGKRTLRQLVRVNGEHMDDLVQARKDSGNHPVWAAVREWEILRKPVSLRWLVETRMNTRDGSENKLTTNSSFPYWVSYKGLSLTDVKIKEQFKKVKWADFSDNLLDDIKKLIVEMPQLEELSLRHNVILEFPVLAQQWTQLQKLDLSRNYLKSIASFQSGCFPSLKLLDVSGNMLNDLNGIQACEDLVECYAACNRITSHTNILPVKNCRSLRMLDLTGNPVEKLRDFRPFCVFHVRELEFLCGQLVEESDVAEANDKFGGRLDHEFLLKTPHSLELSTLRVLTLASCSIRKVTLPRDVLPLLERLDLSYNNLSCLWGLHTLPELKTLRLSFNMVSSLRPPNGGAALSDASGAPRCPTPATPGGTRASPPFPALRMLLLDNNHLSSAKLLGLREMPHLSSLFLQQNDLDSLDGLQGAASLRFLVVDENKIQQIGSGECRGLLALEELWLESNRLSQLFFAQSLRGLRRLFLAGNCVADPTQLRHLSPLRELREITLAGNPLTRRRTFQTAIREFVPLVETLDGEPLESLMGAESDSNAST